MIKDLNPFQNGNKKKRNFIKNQKNKYLQVAMMDPDVYNNDELFEYLTRSSNDYYSFLDYKYHLIGIDGYLNDENFKKVFKKQIDMIKNLFIA